MINLYAVGIVVSIIVYLAVGNYAGRKVKHLEDYFVTGRQSPTLLIVGTLVASFLSTNAFMGESGFAYSGYPAILSADRRAGPLGHGSLLPLTSSK